MRLFFSRKEFWNSHEALFLSTSHKRRLWCQKGIEQCKAISFYLHCSWPARLNTAHFIRLHCALLANFRTKYQYVRNSLYKNVHYIYIQYALYNQKTFNLFVIIWLHLSCKNWRLRSLYRNWTPHFVNTMKSYDQEKDLTVSWVTKKAWKAYSVVSNGFRTLLKCKLTAPHGI